jgi:hypothetical protein
MIRSFFIPHASQARKETHIPALDDVRFEGDALSVQEATELRQTL